MSCSPSNQNSINHEALELDFGKDWSRPYVYVDDVVNAIQLALEAPFRNVKQDAYNISSGIWPTISDIANIVADVTHAGSITLQCGRMPNDYLIGPLDLEAARRDRGFKPQCIMEKGIEIYYEWLQENAF